MTTSADYTLDLDTNDIMEDAFDNLQIGQDGETLTGDMYKRARRTLNLMIKEWEALGTKLWATKQGALFLVKGSHEYSFATANLANTFYETDLTVAGIATDTTVTVTSDDNISASDTIQILLDDGTAHWTTVNGAPVANVVTLTAALPSAAAIGKKVRNYRGTFVPVSRIKDVRRRDSASSEIPVIFDSEQTYFRQVDKTSAGDPIQAWFKRGIPSGTMHVWGQPDESDKILLFTYDAKLQIMTTSTETFDLPDYWHSAIVYNLAYRLIPKFGCAMGRKEVLMDLATTSMTRALSYDTELYPVKVSLRRR